MKTYKDYMKLNGEDFSHEICGKFVAHCFAMIDNTFHSAKPWTWFIGLVTDGYWMIFFSPLIILNWILVSIFYLPWICLLFALFIISLVWFVLIETPAALMNKEKLTMYKLMAED